MIFKKLTLFLLASLSFVLPKNSKEKKHKPLAIQSKKNTASVMTIYYQKQLLQEFPITDSFMQLFQNAKSEQFFVNIIKALNLSVKDIASVAIKLNCTLSKNNNLEQNNEEEHSAAQIYKIVITKNNQEKILLENEEQIQVILNNISQNNPNIIGDVTAFVQKNGKLLQQVLQENQIVGAIPQMIAQIMQNNQLNELNATVLFNFNNANITINLS